MFDHLHAMKEVGICLWSAFYFIGIPRRDQTEASIENDVKLLYVLYILLTTIELQHFTCSNLNLPLTSIFYLYK